jgi:TPR repeat protein
MDYKQKIIDIFNTHKYVYDHLQTINDEEIITKLYNLFANNVIYEPITAIDMYYLGRYYRIMQDGDNTIKYLLMAYDYGCDEALDSLSNYYLLKNDYKNGLKYLLMSFDNGNNNNAIMLGDYYDNIEKDYEKAIKYYLIGVENGKFCFNNIGICYKKLGDYVNAKKYYLIAIANNCKYASLNLGIYYLNIERDYENALKYFLMESEKDNNLNADIGECYFNIAKSYINFKNDYDNGIKYLLMAIEYKNIEAAAKLAYIYDEYMQDYKNAIKYYLMAVDKKPLLNNIGICYKNLKDYENAKKYYLMAIENNSVLAMANLGRYYMNIEKNYELGIKYCLMAVDNNYDDAMCKLGRYYIDIEKNYELGIKYMLMAIDKNNTDAMYNLAAYYFNNNNYELFEKYIYMAIKNNDKHAIKKIKKYYNHSKQHFKLLELYLNYENTRERHEIITMFNVIMNEILTPEQNIKFLQYITSFEFNENDKLCSGLQLLINSLNEKLTLLDLHFNYTIEGKGYNDAKQDFFERCIQ